MTGAPQPPSRRDMLARVGLAGFALATSGCGGGTGAGSSSVGVLSAVAATVPTPTPTSTPMATPAPVLATRFGANCYDLSTPNNPGAIWPEVIHCG